jgi:hypothetical protein
LDARASRQLQADERIRVLSTNPIKVSVNLDGVYGRSLVAEFQK